MSLSALPPPAMSLAALRPAASQGLGVAAPRADAARTQRTAIGLPGTLAGGATLHISPHDPGWTAAQYEHAFLQALGQAGGDTR